MPAGMFSSLYFFSRRLKSAGSASTSRWRPKQTGAQARSRVRRSSDSIASRQILRTAAFDWSSRSGRRPSARQPDSVAW